MSVGGYAKVRNTELGSLIENFIDDNRQDLSPVLFDRLEELAEKVDEDAAFIIDERQEFSDRIDTLDEHVNQLQAENEQLKDELEESK